MKDDKIAIEIRDTIISAMMPPRGSTVAAGMVTPACRLDIGSAIAKYIGVCIVFGSPTSSCVRCYQPETKFHTVEECQL